MRPTSNNRGHSYDTQMNSFIEYNDSKTGNPLCRLFIYTEANYIINTEKVPEKLFENFIAGKSLYRFEETKLKIDRYPIENIYEINYLNLSLSGDVKDEFEKLFNALTWDEALVRQITNSYFK